MPIFFWCFIYAVSVICLRFGFCLDVSLGVFGFVCVLLDVCERCFSVFGALLPT